MQRQPVESSNLKSVGFESYIDSAQGILEVEFKSGSVYQYFQVPEVIYHELLNAESKGRYHYHNIRGEFDYERIK